MFYSIENRDDKTIMSLARNSKTKEELLKYVGLTEGNMKYIDLFIIAHEQKLGTGHINSADVIRAQEVDYTII